MSSFVTVSATISEVVDVGDHTSRSAVVMGVAIAGIERVGHARASFLDSFGLDLTCLLLIRLDLTLEKTRPRCWSCEKVPMCFANEKPLDAVFIKVCRRDGDDGHQSLW